MNIQDLVDPSNSHVDLRAPNKKRLLEDLSSRASASLGIPQAAVLDALLKREDLGSTGMGHGVAIPHARLPAVIRPFGILARLRAPIEFEAVDERPVDIVFLLLLPARPEATQLNALACVARRLRESETIDKLHAASDNGMLYRALVES